MKVKFIKNYKNYKRGDEEIVSKNFAFGLFDKKVAKEISEKEAIPKNNKMMTKKTKKVKTKWI